MIYQKIEKKKILKKLTRAVDANKSAFGHVLVIAGNKGYGGAALLASKASLVVGSGLTTLATVKEHVPASLAYCPEVMAKEVENLSDLENHLDNKDVICAGPGLGKNFWAEQMIYKSFESASKRNIPLVLDADGLNILSEENLKLRKQKKLILTPHPGEAARLLKCSVEDIQNNRLKAIKKIIKKYNATVVLKGYETLIGNKSKIFRCQKGNPGMAVGGMGDVLSGFISGFLAQGLSLIDACCLATEVHAETADKYAILFSERSLLPSDLIEMVKQSF